VAPVTIGFGVVMILLGVGGYVITDRHSYTALIPAGFGIVLVVLGFLAFKDHLRKHVMHGAAALALIGFIMTAARLPYGTIFAGGPFERPVAVGEQAIMAGLCALFVGLCVRSFIAARRARNSKTPK
jgi:hypothetical protein